MVQHQAGLKELSKVMQNPAKKPDRQWLLLLIAAVGGPEHPMFAKPKPIEAGALQSLFKQVILEEAESHRSKFSLHFDSWSLRLSKYYH